ncbi:MAG TPA: hypothetical protein DDZ51_11890 [Planctomycetaceae bacterium]|nr:hypothetical protein [Planctomycetaceae bacterium]
MIGKQNPIAIVGMACRFPKGLNSIETLWNALKNRFSAIDTVPAERWSVDRYFSSNPIAKGKSYIKRGGFLSCDIRKFDASFFGISPRDAENMDPQQRLLLEVVWEAFENAGMILPNYAGKNIGVYVGGFMLDHMITQMSSSNRSAINQNTAAGMMMTMLSNRISHTFDFRGPSLSIDTACSSSLVAFHYACQDLWHNNTEFAIVGGSNVMLRPEYPMGMCKGQFLSRDGECKSFDSRGDGYGRGEGAGVVLLKPLDTALRDGDEVLATVIATGSNQDGRTPGISMPSREAQKALIESVCSRYEVEPASINYVECHGTGTAVGDPTETGAIAATYGEARRAKNLTPVIVGSIKSNIGHLEAAAGVAGVIKATLTLLHRETTPLANLIEPNPQIPLTDSKIRLSNEAIRLGLENEDIRVAVNSFGYGGSNAHAILQSAPNAKMTLDGQGADATRASELPMSQDFPFFLPLSARSDRALSALAGKYADLLRTNVALGDVLFSAMHRRAHLTHRAVVKAKTRQELIDALDAFANNTESDHVVKGVAPYNGIRKPVFVFTGMGPQWWAMGQELYRANSIYRNAVNDADQIFQQISGFSILAEMLRNEDESEIKRTEFAQPANLMIQIGLLAVLNKSGIEPGAVVGHSVGELASAYAAGVLDLKDTLTVCYHRSRLQATCKGTGAMLAVGLSSDQIKPQVERFGNSVSIAAINGPSNVTIAGETNAIMQISAELTAQSIFNKLLEVEVPYHSPMMDPILNELESALANVRTQSPRIPLYSTVTGLRVNHADYGADYWPKNVRQPVDFRGATASILNDGYNVFLEVGPHPVLSTSINDCAKDLGKDCRLLFMLRRNQPEESLLLRSVMSVFASGCDLKWDIHCNRGKHTTLPNYPWQGEDFWMENDRARQERIGEVVFPMLGIQEAPGVPAYRNDFDHEPVLYLRDHVVTGLPILPAAGYVETLLELASIHQPDAAAYIIRDFQIFAPMIITADRGLDCVTTYDPATQSATIRSLENGRLGPGQTHVTARTASLSRFKFSEVNISAMRAGLEKSVSTVDFYRNLDSIGLTYGPAFQTVKEIYTNTQASHVVSRIEVQSEGIGPLAQYRLHPTLLDACFQSLMVLLGDSNITYLPTGFTELCVYAKRSPKRVWCIAERVSQDDRQIICNLTLVDDAGSIVASLRSMKLSAASKRQRTDRFGDPVKRQILEYQWQYGETLSEPKRLGYWLIVGNEHTMFQQVSDRLESYGAIVSGVATRGDDYRRDGNQFTLRYSDVTQANQLFTDLGELDGVLFLSGLSASASSNDPTGEIAVGEIATLTRAMLSNPSTRTPRVYVVTQSAFQIPSYEGNVEPAQTAINGYVRVAFNELEGLRFSTVDVQDRIDDSLVDCLALELLCDSHHDEVALRGGLRLCSELRDSTLLTSDRVETNKLDDSNPVLIRALRPDVESVGTARIVSAPTQVYAECDIRIRVESTVVPPGLLNPATADAIHQPVVEFVGTVIAAGSQVLDLEVGMRVIGFGPPEIASHFVGPRESFYLTRIDEAFETPQILGELKVFSRAEQVVSSLAIAPSQTALIEATPIGIEIAKRLKSKGVCVTLLRTDLEDTNEVGDNCSSLYSLCPEGIASAVSDKTKNRGFDYVAVSLAHWQRSFDLTMVRVGGVLIDLEEQAAPASLPANVGGLVRTDLQFLLQDKSKVEKTLARLIANTSEQFQDSATLLQVGLADLAWQKLPIADTNARIILHFETRGSDLPVVQRDTYSLDPTATYLITGGFGGFGRETARWLMAQGARNIVLTGRTGADNDDRKSFVKSLENGGANVLATACDTSDIKRLQEVLAQISSTMPPLRGVFHSGAEIIDQPIQELDLETLGRVMRSKALGAWNLHQATQGLPLEHFVLYSSVANLVGNSRQSAYSAANGFLNGLAHMRNALGQPATSVNWGAIADVGVVAKDEKLEQFLRYTGLRGIESSEALEVMRIALSREVVQFGVTMITSWADWARFETRGATSPRFAALISADSQGQDTSTRDALIAELKTLNPADRVELLTTLIVEIVAAVLKADPATIPFDKSINQLGVDSLMATEIQMLLDTKLGLSVSILELIGDTSVRAIATQCISNMQLS